MDLIGFVEHGGRPQRPGRGMGLLIPECRDYPLGKPIGQRPKLGQPGGAVGASGAPIGFAEVRFAEVLNPQIIQEIHAGSLKESVGEM
jgi:hypothetical protein